jgi:type I restriction enzyme S subunit
MDFSDSERKKFELRPGDLLVCEGGEVGRTAIWRGEKADCYYQKALHRLRPRNGAVLPEYMLHFMKYAAERQLFAGFTSTTSIAHLTREKLATVRLPLPPLSEQRRIADILDKADAIRRRRQEAVNLANEFLRSAFLEMFGDPVTNPKGWLVVTIDSLGAARKNALAIGPFGSSLKKEDYRGEGHPVIFVRDVREDRFSWRSNVFVDDAKYVELSSHRVTARDVVATKMGLPPCIAAVYPNDMPDGIITADIIKVSVDDTVATPEFVSSAINSEFCKRQVARFTEGITRPKVTLRDFRSLEVPCPPLEAQRRWSGLVARHQASAENLAAATRHTSDLFDSLVQRAFRGEL